MEKVVRYIIEIHPKDGGFTNDLEILPEGTKPEDAVRRAWLDDWMHLAKVNRRERSVYLWATWAPEGMTDDDLSAVDRRMETYWERHGRIVIELSVPENGAVESYDEFGPFASEAELRQWIEEERLGQGLYFWGHPESQGEDEWYYLSDLEKDIRPDWWAEGCGPVMLYRKA